MASIGKKILSAFVDVGEDKKQPRPADVPPEDGNGAAGPSPETGRAAVTPQMARGSGSVPAATATGSVNFSAGTDQDRRFAGYFDKLFDDANIPGPDYYEFARMIGAMQVIPDERARYAAAFAGLQVQGLDREKLLATANEYLRVLSTDADQFRKTVDAALQEKVHGRSAEAEAKSKRIEALSQEILQLQQEIGALQKEIAENREKLDASDRGYAAESERRSRQIQADIEKIKQYIQP
jgi:peptidoglycan hydrolase CwlO-like protein